MEPIVNLYKLGRMSFNGALDVQQILFKNLSINLLTTQMPPNGEGANVTPSHLKGAGLQGRASHLIADKQLYNNTNIGTNIINDNHKNIINSNNNTVKSNISSDSIYHTQNLTHGQHVTSNELTYGHVSLRPTNQVPTQSRFQEKINTVRNSLILVEHEPTYTIGIRRKIYGDGYLVRLMNELETHKLKAEFIETNRGGLVTFHGPGQLVAYPILYLGDFGNSIKNKSLRLYVELLEKTIIDTLARVGIKNAHTVPEYPGVWVANGERKIAFVGISCKRYITMHGISINCDCDLSWFDHIVSCGIEDKIITSIKQETRKLPRSHDNRRNSDTISVSEEEHQSPSNDSNSTIDNVSREFCSSFSQHFNCNLIEAAVSLISSC